MNERLAGIIQRRKEEDEFERKAKKVWDFLLVMVFVFMLGFAAYIHFFIAPNLPEGIFPAGCIR